MNDEIEIFVVEFSWGKADIASVKVIEKAKTYNIIQGTQVNYFGNQYLNKQIRKGENVFTNARSAAVYAAKLLAEYIEKQQEKLGVARTQLEELNSMLR